MKKALPVTHRLAKLSRPRNRLPLGCENAIEALESRRMLTAIPAPLTVNEIGTPTGGSASFDGSTQTFTIVGSGYDIFGPADGAETVLQPLTGDGTVTVQVISDIRTNNHSLAGLTIRDSLSPTASNMWIAARDGGTVFVDSRLTNGAVGLNDFGTAPGSLPEFVRLTRTGSTVQAFYSTDGGNTYQLLDTQTIAFTSNTVLVGMAVSSQVAPGILATAQFQNFSVVPAGGTTAHLTSAPAVSSNTTTPYQFTVTYNSSNLIDAASLGNNNWIVQLPDGSTEPATLVTTGLTNGSTVVATYQVAPPRTDGTYTIKTGTAPVTDLLAVQVPAGTLGTFSVAPSDTVNGLVRTPQLAGIAGATVFADTNGNGVHDSGEVSTTSISSGAYSLSGLPDGTYNIVEIAPTGQQVLPNASQTVTFSGHQTLNDLNFVNTAADTIGSTTNLMGVFVTQFPTSIQAGTASTAKIRITNTGTHTLSKTVNLTELLTTDGTASGAVALLKTSPVRLNLKAGHSVDVPVSFIYPAGMTGSFKVLGVVDSANVLAESNKRDNVFVGSAVNVTAEGSGAHFIVANLKSAPKVTRRSSAPYKFTVTYTATGSKVNPLRIGNNNWVVEFPDTSVHATLLVKWIKTPASRVVATYMVAAPIANGTYTIETFTRSCRQFARRPGCCRHAWNVYGRDSGVKNASRKRSARERHLVPSPGAPGEG